jgi:hypothetical protein
LIDRFARFTPAANVVVLLSEHHGEESVIVWELAVLH